MIENLQDIEAYVEQTYNKYISVYDYGEYVRITNGSADHYADVLITNNGQLEVRAERYGETYHDTHKPTTDGLSEALSRGLGL